MHVNLYVDQIAALSQEQKEAGPDWNQLMNDNCVLLRDYSHALATGALPKKFDKEGNEIEQPLSPIYECYARRIYSEAREILRDVWPMGSWELPIKFPGVQSVDISTKTFNALLTREDFIRNRTQPIKVGKYFKRLGLYDDDTVNHKANQLISHIRIMREAKLELARTEADIVEVYETGPSSCMSGDSGCFDTDGLHPAAVYATPDIACAFVRVKNRIVARAMVNLIDDQYSTIYGNAEMLRILLQDAGYTSGYLDGCRINAIECNGTYLMPYIDGADEVGEAWDQPGYFIVGNSGYCCTHTNGLSEDGICCPACGDMFNPDYDGCWVDGADQTYCSESCAEEDGYVYTTDYNEYRHVDDCYYCQTDNSWYYLADQLIEVDGEYYHNEDDDIVFSEDQDEYIFRADAVYIHDIHSWVDDDRELEFTEDDEHEAA